MNYSDDMVPPLSLMQAQLGPLAALVAGAGDEPGLPTPHKAPLPTVQNFWPSGAAPGRVNYQSTWKWKAPPGIGDAPQQVWSTYWLAPQDFRGPGDVPMGVRACYQPTPSMQPYYATLFGRPVDGGSYLMRQLSANLPILPPEGLGLKS